MWSRPVPLIGDATSARDRSGDPRDWAPYNAEPPLAALAGSR